MESSNIVAGLRLGCTFSWDCQTAKDLKINDKLLGFIKGELSPQKVEVFLRKLGSYYGYFRLSLGNGSNPFDLQNVSSYWRGSNQLDKLFAKIKPKNAVNFPFHNYSVLAKFRPSHLDAKICRQLFKNIVACTIQRGKIIDSTQVGYLIDCQPINWTKSKGFHFGSTKRKLIKKGLLAKKLLGPAKYGDIVAHHFGSARLILNKEEEKNLLHYTKLAFDSLNAK